MNIWQFWVGPKPLRLVLDHESPPISILLKLHVSVDTCSASFGEIIIYYRFIWGFLLAWVKLAEAKNRVFTSGAGHGQFGDILRTSWQHPDLSGNLVLSNLPTKTVEHGIAGTHWYPLWLFRWHAVPSRRSGAVGGIFGMSWFAAEAPHSCPEAQAKQRWSQKMWRWQREFLDFMGYWMEHLWKCQAVRLDG